MLYYLIILLTAGNNFENKCRKNETFSSVAIRNINRPRLCKLVYPSSTIGYIVLEKSGKISPQLYHSYRDNHFVHKIYYHVPKLVSKWIILTLFPFIKDNLRMDPIP